MPDRVGSCRVTGFGHPGKTNSEGTHYDNGTGTVVICQGIHVYESVPRLHEGLALFIRGAKLMFVKPGVAEARLAKPSQTMLSHSQFNAVVRGFSQTNIAPCIVEFRSGKSSLTENERTIRQAKTADSSSFLTSQASRTGSGDNREVTSGSRHVL